VPKTAVVILNWNGRKFLQQFLHSIVLNSKNVADVIIADNASTDGSVDFLRKEFPDLTIIQNSRNEGFSKGYNNALRSIQADYYILLNSDIDVPPGWITPLIAMMERDKNIGICQPKIKSYSEREKFEYAGAAGGFIDKFGYPFCRGRLFQSLETDHGQYDREAEIFWATGACMVVRASDFKRLGGLDDDFFAHMEEIDLCWRAKNQGIKIMYCPHSEVYHIGAGTLPRKSALKTYLNIRNNIMMLYKNLPRKRLYVVLGLRCILDIMAALKFLVDGGIKDFWAVFRAYWSFYTRIRKHYHKRKKLHQGNVSNIYQGSIVIEYFIKRKKRFSELNPSRFST
jgi:GT2 family glycosyltransferase